MKTILVTGGTGYIGTHTVVELLKDKNYDVIILDNLSNSNPLILNRLQKIVNKKIKFYNVDCRDSVELNKIFENNKIDGVIHFAAFKSVGESVKEPLLYYDNNINSLINLLNACKKFKVNHFVFSSSCSLYGNVSKLPVTENTKLSEPESPYAYTKLIGERILKDFSNVNNWIKVISLRYFNPVGAHESGLIGESPINKPNNILPVICNSAESGEEITVFGNDYDTPDGTCIRDYVHVSDIANAHYLAMEHLFYGMKLNYDVFNLGSENGYSVLQLINKFEEINKININYKIGNRREGDVVSIYSNSKKAKEILGWKIERNIIDIVESSWLWTKNKI